LSIKKDLLLEIDKKAKKIKEKRVDAANNKSIESAVFEFFKNIEEARSVHNNERYNVTLFLEARKALKRRVVGYAPGTKVSIEFNESFSDFDFAQLLLSEGSTLSWDQQQVRGVTIWWSKAYIAANNVDASLYIDVSQMLFL
jgi:hypothetical protein